MYRFQVINNKADHLPLVVCFSLFAVCFSLFLTHPVVQTLSVTLTCFIGYFSWQWYWRAHPLQGTVILDSGHCHFVNAELEINGTISSKSRVYQHSVWLYIEGLTRSHWLIINTSGVNEQSFIRLKRTVLSSSKV